jgi:hypothetical protein
MLSQEATTNLFNNIHRLWIDPEIVRRKASGSLPPDFKILRCLVRLPQDKAPIIQFNDEIGWVVKIEPPAGMTIAKGQEIYLHDIKKIVAVEPPTVDEKRVAFVFLFWAGQHYSIIFDFSSNVPDEFLSPEEKAKWTYSDPLASLLQSLLVERTILAHDKLQALFGKIALWPAPALLPYPLSEIAHKLENNDATGAIKSLISYCTPSFLQSLTNKWWSISFFQARRLLIEDAIAAHTDNKFTLSIHALLPQLEGIVTDYVVERGPHDDLPWRQESKTKKFRDLIFEKPPGSYAYRRIVESTVKFILEGPVLETFKNWLQDINTAFPNRHVVEHGKFEQTLYCEENSIKLVLLLDTIFHIIANDGQSHSN